MSTSVKSIPDGFTAVTPYLTIKGASDAIEFYKKVFGAEEVMRLKAPGGAIVHAELRVNGAMLMLSDESPQWQALSPKTIGGSGSSIMLYLDDVDAAVQRAIDAGAQPLGPVADQFWGDRCGSFIDPFGHRWTVSTHIEDVSAEEVARRARQLFGDTA